VNIGPNRWEHWVCHWVCHWARILDLGSTTGSTTAGLIETHLFHYSLTVASADNDNTGTTTTNGSHDIGVFVFAGMKEQHEFVALVEDRKQQHHQRGVPEAAAAAAAWLV
jgi:hypothetical protein